MTSSTNLGAISVLMCIAIASGCTTGRIYLGSLNETYPEHVKRNGIYVKQTQDYNGHDVYRHGRTGECLYYVSGSLVGGHWAVGPRPGSTEATISVSTTASSPEMVHNRAWHVWDAAQNKWLAVPGLKAVCVDEDFVTCSSGTVVIGGLSSRRGRHIQQPRMGEYQLTDQISNMRPVYHKPGEVDEYLFFHDDFWIIGPTPGVVSGGLLCVDQAWRPEYITSPWIVFDGYRFERNDGVTIRCKGNDLEEGTSTPPGESGPCDPGVCENGAECLVSLETDSLLCDCQPGYYGLSCENAISCGSAPVIENARVVGATGTNYLDVTFYNCHNILGPSVQLAVTCLSNGSWSTTPSCVEPTAVGPMLPFMAAPNPRRTARLRSLSNVLEELSRS